MRACRPAVPRVPRRERSAMRFGVSWRPVYHRSTHAITEPIHSGVVPYRPEPAGWVIGAEGVRPAKKLIYVNAFRDEIPIWRQQLVIISDGVLLDKIHRPRSWVWLRCKVSCAVAGATSMFRVLPAPGRRSRLVPPPERQLPWMFRCVPAQAFRGGSAAHIGVVLVGDTRKWCVNMASAALKRQGYKCWTPKMPGRDLKRWPPLTSSLRLLSSIWPCRSWEATSWSRFMIRG